MLSKRVNTSLLDSATNFCLQEASILEGIWAEYLKHQLLDTSIEALIHLSKPEDHLISRQLDTIILSQDILGSLINPMTALVVLNTVEDELIANEIRENLTEDIIR